MTRHSTVTNRPSPGDESESCVRYRGRRYQELKHQELQPDKRLASGRSLRSGEYCAAPLGGATPPIGPNPTQPRESDRPGEGTLSDTGDGVRLAFEQLHLEGHGEESMFEAFACGCIDGAWPGSLVPRRLPTAVTCCAIGECHDRPHTDSIVCSHAVTTASRRKMLD